jgi:hypothetical protein
VPRNHNSRQSFYKLSSMIEKAQQNFYVNRVLSNETQQAKNRFGAQAFKSVGQTGFKPISFQDDLVLLSGSTEKSGSSSCASAGS